MQHPNHGLWRTFGTPSGTLYQFCIVVQELANTLPHQEVTITPGMHWYAQQPIKHTVLPSTAAKERHERHKTSQRHRASLAVW
jgi:hypothetical protein